MILKNIGTKIVNVGAKVLMPDAEMTITKLQAETPAIKVLVKHKMLELREEAAKEETKVEETKVEETKVEETKEETKVEEKKAEEPQKEAKKATKKTTAE